jgi:phosphohistidine phosphatase SixA
MKIMNVLRIAAYISIIALISCTSKQSNNTQKPLQVFLVRHGEKIDSSKEAKLSAAGHERAEILAAMLRNAEIEYVHSSDYTRTRDTASPTASAQGLKLDLYNPDDLPALVEKLRKTGGRHLVVGHSNTTHTMVQLLGGKPGSKINDENEYDRLYIVTTAKDGSVNSLLLRYGKIYHQN